MLLDATGVHHHHLIGHLQRLVQIVGNEQAGEMQRVVQLAQPATQLLAHPRVERAKRFVEQQHARLDGERARQGDALALTAGQLGRITATEIFELYQREQLIDAFSDAGGGGALAARLDGQAEGDVVAHRHVLEQRVMLKHEADAAIARVDRRHVLAIEQDGAMIGAVEAGDDAQQGRLAAARWAEQCHQLAARDLETDRVQGVKADEMFAHALNADAHAMLSFKVSAVRCAACARASTKVFSSKVTKANSISIDAQAKAATKLYSL